MPSDSAKRTEAIQQLKTEFPERAEKIDKVVAAYDQYSPFRGRLDDPKDLQRMLKGSGILEFRILPVIGQPGVDADEMAKYVEKLKAKGPKYASDNNYVWCEIENIKDWHNTNTVVAQFGNKYYVLASNKKDECMLRTGTETNWKLTGSRPTPTSRDEEQSAFRSMIEAATYSAESPAKTSADRFAFCSTACAFPLRTSRAESPHRE